MRRRRSTSASSGISTRNGRIEPFDAAAWFGARKLKTPPEARSAADVASAEFARNFRRVGDDESMDILVLPVLMTRRFFASIASRSEEHTSELQSLMRISYAVFCL